MSEDKELEKKKAAAEAKAKAAAAAKARAEAKKNASEGNDSAPAESKEESKEEKPAASADEKAKAVAAAKAKAAAAAKAKAAAAAKAKAAGGAAGSDASDDEKAKAKAAAIAKAKAAAAAKAKAAGGAAGSDTPDDEKAKAKAAAIAKAKAAAAAKANAGGGASAKDESVEEQKPSPNQPILDKYLKVIAENLGEDVLEDSYINRLSKDVPTLVAKSDTYFKVAEFLKYNEQLGFDYLSEIHGTDFQTHMEVYVHLYSYKNQQSVALKVSIDRDQPEIESLVPLWQGANWPESEAYDLLGIRFKNHPDLKRIMLGEDWIGHPLRKDYEPHDVEV